jgi:uncharacterized protein YndB with AHSA1/START domain
MSRVEEMTAVRVAPQQAMRVLTTVARMAEWVAPHVSVTPLTAAATLAPGSRFRLEVLGGPRFDYQVEAETDRELVLSFDGPWSGSERWSFIADGEETIVRRSYEVNEGGLGLAMLAWQTVGRALVIAHYKLELSRFRDTVERSPGPRAEIESRGAPAPSEITSYPVDEG